MVTVFPGGVIERIRDRRSDRQSVNSDVDLTKKLDDGNLRWKQFNA